MYIHILLVVSLLKLGECHNNIFGTNEQTRSFFPRRSRLLSDFMSNIGSDTSRSGFVPVSIPLSSSRSIPSNEQSTTTTTTTTTSERSTSEQPGEFPPSSSTATASPSSVENAEGPMPTADTMRKYARIFRMDTENMNEDQRFLLQKIVQRLARLNGNHPDDGTEDLSDNEARARRKNNDGKKNQKKTPSKTIEVVTNSSRTTVGASKQKTMPSNQNSGGNGSGSGGSTNSNGTSSQKKKVASSNYISIQTVTASPTQPTIASKVGKSKVTQANDFTLANASSVDLGNISTTSIVDILSTDNARENFYIRRPSPSTITTLHNKIQPQKVSVCLCYLLFLLFITIECINICI